MSNIYPIGLVMLTLLRYKPFKVQGTRPHEKRGKQKVLDSNFCLPLFGVEEDQIYTLKGQKRENILYPM